WIELGDQTCWRIVKARCAGADQPKMIKKAAAERSMEEPVCQRVFGSQLVEHQRTAVEVAHWQCTGTGHGNELVHPTIVDLLLFLVEAMYEIAGALPQSLVSIGAEWAVR